MFGRQTHHSPKLNTGRSRSKDIEIVFIPASSVHTTTAKPFGRACLMRLREGTVWAMTENTPKWQP